MNMIRAEHCDIDAIDSQYDHRNFIHRLSSDRYETRPRLL